MDNRNGLLVDVETTEANGRAERQAVAKMLKLSARRAKSLGAGKNYDAVDFVATCRCHQVARHVAAKQSGSAIDGLGELSLTFSTACQNLYRRAENTEKNTRTNSSISEGRIPSLL